MQYLSRLNTYIRIQKAYIRAKEKTNRGAMSKETTSNSTPQIKKVSDVFLDRVKNERPELIEEIAKDPFNWVLSRTGEVVGHEKEKLLTLLAVVSSRVEDAKLHLLLVGDSFTGKSSAVESVLKFVRTSDYLLSVSRFDGLIGAKTNELNGKILFLEHINERGIENVTKLGDNCINVVYNEDVLLPNNVKRYVSREYTHLSVPVIIGTADFEGVKAVKPWLLNRFFTVYVEPEPIEKLNGKRVVNETDYLTFTAWLGQLPNKAELSDAVNKRVEKYLKELKGLGNTAKAHVLLKKLLITVAVAKGKTAVGEEEFEFVMKNFKADLLLNALNLTPLEAKIVKAIDEVGGKTTHELSEELNVSKSNLRGVLKSLAKKDIIDVDVDDTWVKEWRLMEKGKAIKRLLEKYKV
jgi:DNA-binding MarR family transcriptional regulator